MSAKKIIIAVSLDEATQRPFSYLKEFPFSNETDIQLIHMVTETIYAKGMVLESLSFPSAEDRPKIESEVTRKLEDFREKHFPQHPNVMLRVIFDSNIKAAFTEYVKMEKADLVVVATRGRHGIKGLFDSSFAQHQLKYSPTNILVFR